MHCLVRKESARKNFTDCVVVVLNLFFKILMNAELVN